MIFYMYFYIKLLSSGLSLFTNIDFTDSFFIKNNLQAKTLILQLNIVRSLLL